jgi:flagellin-like hook-associated protein FlgL
MSDVTLSAASRSNLLSLSNTTDLINRTSTRLSTNLKVSSVIDDAVAYFQAKSLSDRGSDFAQRQATIDQGISSVKAALNATEAVDKILKQMKGIAQAAAAQSTAERIASSRQFKDLGRQVSRLVEDASYQGLNLLNATRSKLTVQFSEKSLSQIIISGFDLNASSITSGRGLTTAAALFGGVVGGTDFQASGLVVFGAGKFSGIGASIQSVFTVAVDRLDAAISRLRGIASELGGNVALLQTRLDFTKSYVNTLQEGSGKLTLADLNEEGANLVSLQTRQSLGIQALSFAGQSEQSILSLFR